MDKQFEFKYENEINQEFYQSKLQEQDFLLQLIPDVQCTKNSLRSLKQELAKSTSSSLPKERKSFIKRMKTLLNTTIFTIEV